MMWWAVWCVAAAAAVCARAAPGPALPPLDLTQIDQPTSDDEALSYAVGPLSARYAGEPWLYLLTDLPHEPQSGAVVWGSPRAVISRPKRKMPSLSINNPMEVLRQRLMQEVARKQMREASQRQAVANRLFLQNVGKRGFWTNTAPHARYNIDN